MSIARISLYRHELEIIAKLTVELSKLRQDECSHLAIENVGPEIFGKLLEIMYSPVTTITTVYRGSNEALPSFDEVRS